MKRQKLKQNTIIMVTLSADTKVESAKTFDAGIAMYVDIRRGTTDSAAVLKKED